MSTDKPRLLRPPRKTARQRRGSVINWPCAVASRCDERPRAQTAVGASESRQQGLSFDARSKLGNCARAEICTPAIAMSSCAAVLLGRPAAARDRWGTGDLVLWFLGQACAGAAAHRPRRPQRHVSPPQAWDRAVAYPGTPNRHLPPRYPKLQITFSKIRQRTIVRGAWGELAVQKLGAKSKTPRILNREGV